MAKQIIYGEESRQAILRGVNQLADAVKVTPLDVAVGDRVLFGKWSGTEVKVSGEDLLIMKESDILGVIA